MQKIQNLKNLKIPINQSKNARDYLNMIDQAIYPNQIFVQLFIVIPEELQKIHARYVLG